MTQRTSDLVAGTIPYDAPQIIGEFHPVVYRADGTVDDYGWKRNQLTARGLNRIARRSVDVVSPAAYLAVGTVTLGASLNWVVTSFGEVSRKISTVLTSAATSREWFFMVATWGGASDSLTGVALDSAAICDHVNSGQGNAWNIVNGLGVTLQASDVLNLTARIRVGSHDVDNN